MWISEKANRIEIEYFRQTLQGQEITADMKGLNELQFINLF